MKVITAPFAWCTSVVLTAVVFALGGCGAGFNAETDQPFNPGAGINDRAGTIYLLNAIVVADDKGAGTLVATLANESGKDDKLLSVTATDATGTIISVSMPNGAVDLPAGQAVQLLTNNDVTFNSPLLKPGFGANLSFEFEKAAAIRINVPVTGRLAEFSTVTIPTSTTPATPTSLAPATTTSSP